MFIAATIALSIDFSVADQKNEQGGKTFHFVQGSRKDSCACADLR